MNDDKQPVAIPRRRQVHGFPGYQVDDLGSVYGKNKSLKLLARPNSNGYLMVNLYHEGRKFHRSVHSVVLEAFVEPRPLGLQGCHMDGNKSNNRLSNLKWGSRSENESHKHLHGTATIGMRNGAAKLSDEQVAKILLAKNSGKVRWGRNRLAREFNVAPLAITEVAMRRTHRHIAVPSDISQEGEKP